MGSLEITVQSKPRERKTLAKAGEDPRRSPWGDTWRGSHILVAPSSQAGMTEYSGSAHAGTRSSTISWLSEGAGVDPSLTGHSPARPGRVAQVARAAWLVSAAPRCCSPVPPL